MARVKYAVTVTLWWRGHTIAIMLAAIAVTTTVMPVRRTNRRLWLFAGASPFPRVPPFPGVPLFPRELSLSRKPPSLAKPSTAPRLIADPAGLVADPAGLVAPRGRQVTTFLSGPHPPSSRALTPPSSRARTPSDPCERSKLAVTFVAQVSGADAAVPVLLPACNIIVGCAIPSRHPGPCPPGRTRPPGVQ